jgi:hypothetical protein
MRVTGHNDLNPSTGRFDIHECDVVNCVDEYFFDFEQLRGGKIFCPPTPVVVAAHGSYRRNARQLRKYISTPNIASVHDVITSLEERDDLGPE